MSADRDDSFAAKVIAWLDEARREGLVEQTGPDSWRITAKGRAALADEDRSR